MDDIWQPPPDMCMTDDETVDVWMFATDPGSFCVDMLLNILADDEKERARRYVTDELARDYIVSRYMLRSILGRYAQVSASGIQFSYTSYGKPMLSEMHNRKIEFNLSHSRGICLAGITSGTPLGVDVEFISPTVSWREIAGEFTSAERELIDTCDDDKKRKTFYNIWTRKEALMKGIGHGLSIGLKDIEVTNFESEPIYTGKEEIDMENWRIYDIDLASTYAAACACHKKIRFMRLIKTHIDIMSSM